MATRYILEEVDPIAGAQQADVFVYTVGYETRSSFIRDSVERDPKNSLALVYDSAGKGVFNGNLTKCLARGDQQVSVDRKAIASTLKSVFEGIRANNKSLTVAVDVSCMDRSLMATVFLELFGLLRPTDRFVVLYAPAEYQEPRILLPPLRSFQPAVPELAAPVGSPYQKRLLIMGLGYEYGAALNVLNILEPHRAHLLVPIGSDDRYATSVRKANFSFDFGVGDYEVTSYQLDRPIALHAIVRNLVFSYSHYGSIVIVPFGPKLLSAVCLLVAMNNRLTVTFMRYSVESSDYFADVRPSGDVYGFVLEVIEQGSAASTAD